MFGSKYTYQLVVTNRSMTLMRVSEKPEFLVETLASSPWQEDNFVPTLTEVLKPAKNQSIRVLLSDDMCYVTSFEVPENVTVDRQWVQHRAEKIIPERLNRVRWDYQLHQVSDQLYRAQVTALTLRIDALFDIFFQHNQTEFEVILPYSLALQPADFDQVGTFIMLHHDQFEPLALVVHQGTVYSTHSLVDATLEELQGLYEYLQTHTNFDLGRVVLSNFKQEVVQSIVPDSVEIVSQAVSPILNLHQKTDIKGRDSQVLNIPLEKGIIERGPRILLAPTPGSKANLEESLKHSGTWWNNNGRLLLILALIGIIAGSLFIGAWYWWQRDAQIEPLSPVGFEQLN